jgi:hypothetical protein
MSSWKRDALRRILKLERDGERYRLRLVFEKYLEASLLDDPSAALLMLEDLSWTVNLSIHVRKDLITRLIDCKRKKDFDACISTEQQNTRTR